MAGVSEFLSMNGYGSFVWPAYLIAAAVLIGLLAMVLNSLSRSRETLKLLEAERETQRDTAPSMSEENNHP
jgi:heme exporter protein CcmD